MKCKQCMYLDHIIQYVNLGLDRRRNRNDFWHPNHPEHLEHPEHAQAVTESAFWALGLFEQKPTRWNKCHTCSDLSKDVNMQNNFFWEDWSNSVSQEILHWINSIMILGWGGWWGIRATGSWTGTVRDQRSYEAAAMYWVCVQWSVVDGKQHRYIATHIYEHQNRDHGSAREERILLRAGLRHRCSPMGLTTSSSSSSREGLTPPSSPHGDAPARASIHDPIPTLS